MRARALCRGLASCVLLVSPGAAGQTPAPSPSPSPEAREESRDESAPASLARTSLSGYLQARATEQVGATPESNFFVRRARLNVHHAFDRGRFALSFDGGQNTVTVKDAYLDVFLTQSHGQRQGLTLRAGQFLRPFGLTIERSSTEREFPERPLGWSVLFPGNRDQGFSLSLGLTAAAKVDIAIVNGGGTSSSGLSFRDSDDHKDVMARVRYALFGPRVDLAASVYLGRQTIAGDSAIEADRTRWGLAANVYDLLGGSARFEYVSARDLASSLAAGPPGVSAPARCWYVSYVRAVGNAGRVGLRYDEFDPDTHDAARLRGDGELRTLGLVALRQVGELVRLTIAWERPWLTNDDPAARASSRSHHDLWTLQVQYRF